MSLPLSPKPSPHSWGLRQRAHTAEPCVPTGSPTFLSGWPWSVVSWVGVQLLLGQRLGGVPTLTWVRGKSVGSSPRGTSYLLLRERHPAPGGVLGFPVLPRPLVLTLGCGCRAAVREHGCGEASHQTGKDSPALSASHKNSRGDTIHIQLFLWQFFFVCFLVVFEDFCTVPLPLEAIAILFLPSNHDTPLF